MPIRTTWYKSSPVSPRLVRVSFYSRLLLVCVFVQTSKAENLKRVLEANLKYQAYLREQIDKTESLMGKNSEKRVSCFLFSFRK